MLGLRIGPKIGARGGAAVGVSADPIAPDASGPGVAQDGPSSWYVPGSAADFSALGITAPTSLWLCQEAAGSLADTIGGLALAPTGTVGYQAAVAGWTRLAATVPAGAGNRFGRAITEEPIASARSVLYLAYVDVSGAAGSSRCMIVGSDSAGATEVSARASATNTTQMKCLTVTTTGAADVTAGGVRAIALLYDRTNGRTAAYSDAEKVNGTYGAGVVDGNKGFGAGVTAAQAMSIVWACCWTDAAAELTDAQVKTILQALNIAIPWS